MQSPCQVPPIFDGTLLRLFWVWESRGDESPLPRQVKIVGESPAGPLSVALDVNPDDIFEGDVLHKLALWDADNALRDLPWKQSPVNYDQRHNEDVRPIFWSIRPKSYVCRTSDWDQFPNGRWGNSSAASFGDLKDYHIFYSPKANPKDVLNQLGPEIEDERDVWHIFEAFILGEPNKYGHKVS